MVEWSQTAPELSFRDADEAFQKLAGYRSRNKMVKSSAGVLVMMDGDVVTVIPFGKRWEHLDEDQQLHGISLDDDALGALVVQGLRQSEPHIPTDPTAPSSS
ncbi:MAG: hypothetical protein LH630_01510 [Actinomycetia bacterium]|nr:hypothetical protein [Actinomycetes bacterium]